jgi:hypothetical protein
MAAGIAVDFDLDGPVEIEKLLEERLNATEEGLASGGGIGVGLQDDFVKDVGILAYALAEEHAHGVDVEIDGPGKGVVGIESNGLNVGCVVEGVVGAMTASAGELGFKFLAVAIGVELPGCGAEFVFSDIAALGGSELKSGPLRIGGSVFKEILKMITATGSADEQGGAATVGERGAESFEPSFGAQANSSRTTMSRLLPRRESGRSAPRMAMTEPE